MVESPALCGCSVSTLIAFGILAEEITCAKAQGYEALSVLLFFFPL